MAILKRRVGKGMIQIQVWCVHYYTELDSVVLYGYTKKKSWKRNGSDTGMIRGVIRKFAEKWHYIKMLYQLQ